MKFVSGGAKGADSFGEEYAAAHDVKVTVFKPDWKKYGKAAGPIRNKDMLDYASEDNPVVIAFWDGKSKGTNSNARYRPFYLRGERYIHGEYRPAFP